MGTDYLVFTDDAIPILPIFNGLALASGNAAAKSGSARGHAYNPMLVHASGAGTSAMGKGAGIASLKELCRASGAGVGSHGSARSTARQFTLVHAHGAPAGGATHTAKGTGYALGLVHASGQAASSSGSAYGRCVSPRSQENLIYRVKEVKRIPGAPYAKAVLEPVERPADR